MPLPEADRKLLHQLALDSIKYSLDRGYSGRTNDALFESTLRLSDFSDDLRQPRATFVTLHLHDELRGCIGTLQAHQPLVFDVVQNARSAAFQDPRFSPVTKSEFPLLEPHISVLSIPEPIEFSSEEDLLEKIRPGIDGLVLTAAGHRGTFLPSVWDSLPTTREFWLHLKNKAGLPANYWSNSVKVERYITESF